jgi:hypothetical protein
MEERKLNRINDKKYTEHLEKGYDLLTLDDINHDKAKYEIKPHLNTWEKIMMDSNSTKLRIL